MIPFSFFVIITYIAGVRYAAYVIRDYNMK